MVIYIKELFKGLEALRLALCPTWSTPALQLQWETRFCFSSYFEVPHPRVLFAAESPWDRFMLEAS